VSTWILAGGDPIKRKAGPLSALPLLRLKGGKSGGTEVQTPPPPHLVYCQPTEPKFVVESFEIVISSSTRVVSPYVEMTAV
jgi:hypothetical protein